MYIYVYIYIYIQYTTEPKKELHWKAQRATLGLPAAQRVQSEALGCTGAEAAQGVGTS